MTLEETITMLELAIAEVEWNYPLDISIALETAIEALNKQIAKKIIEQTEEDREFIDYICPNCKTTLQQKMKSCFAQRFHKTTVYKYRYCLHCGQALWWGDT